MGGEAASHNFEQLQIWQESMALAVQVYELLGKCKDFKLRDQIQRSAVSIPSNIAEGFERQSNKEFIQFLYIAKGSSGEFRTQIRLAQKVGLLCPEKAEELIEQACKISSQIYRLIAYRKTLESKNTPSRS